MWTVCLHYGFLDIRISGSQKIRISEYLEVRKSGYIIRISGFPDIRKFWHSAIWMSEKPDFPDIRISAESDISKSGCPDTRTSGNLELVIAGDPDIRKYGHRERQMSEQPMQNLHLLWTLVLTFADLNLARKKQMLNRFLCWDAFSVMVRVCSSDC